MQIIVTIMNAVRSVASLILRNKSRYQYVEKITGVPWFFIGCIHYREADCNFHCHLHNGDPLTTRTVHVPNNRPPHGEPPFTWEESAIDALQMRGLKSGKVTSVETFAYEAEGYNGWGYRGKGVTSPYLWSGTNEHERGKYIADHVYDQNAIDKEEGVMPILQQLMQLDPSIKFTTVSTEAPQAPQVPAQPPAQAPVSKEPGRFDWVVTLLSAILSLISSLFKRK